MMTNETVVPPDLGLEQGGQGNVVLGHHTVEHVLVLLAVLYGHLDKRCGVLMKRQKRTTWPDGD